MDFTFYSAGEIIFGKNKLACVGRLAQRFGKRAMLCVRGNSMEEQGILAAACDSLDKQKIDYFIFSLPDGEPVLADIDSGTERARKENPDMIIGLGGGSTVDTAKAISGLATNPGCVEDYLEGVGKGKSIEKPSLPNIAVPTTSGTGAEVTKNAVISSREKKYKKSIRSPFLIPDIALLDPLVTLSVPPQITAETGMDALTQLIESYISKKAQPIPRALAIYGIRIAGRFLKRAVCDGSDQEAREGMMLASLMSGLALANSGLGAAHGIAAALGAVAQIPHGRACAVLLPLVLLVNKPACSVALTEIGQAFGLESDKNREITAQSCIDFVAALCIEIGIPQKLEPGEIDEKSIPQLVSASRGSSMKGNPVDLDDRQIEDILRRIVQNP
jgi:alcohol dehydrogenase class IV